MGFTIKVFEGAVEVDTLEGVYQMFNCDCPEDFQGHSLSVSDVVEIVNGVKMLASISVTALAFSL